MLSSFKKTSTFQHNFGPQSHEKHRELKTAWDLTTFFLGHTTSKSAMVNRNAARPILMAIHSSNSKPQSLALPLALSYYLLKVT